MPLLTPQSGPEKIAWSIDGVPVTVEWRSAAMTAPGGYENMTGTVTGSLQQRRLRQGAVIVGTRPNGKVLYKGLLVSQPKITNGVATVEAEGFQGVIRRRNKRLPYIIADSNQWSSKDEDPLSYSVNNQKFSLTSKNDSIGWQVDGNTSYATGNDAGYGLYVAGHPVQRVRCTLIKTGDDANFDMKWYDADDLGSLGAAVHTESMGAGNPTGTSFNVSAVNHNTVVLTLEYTAGGGMPSGGSDKFMLRGLAACVIADDTDWVTSDVASDIASRVGFADNVSDSGTEIGSLDWTSGWDELLDYMAAIEDWTWLIEEDRTKNGPGQDAMLTFRPWGNHEWTTNLDMAQVDGLTVAPMYNQVTVQYERPAGVPQHQSYNVADFSDLDDPIVDGRTYEYPDQPVLENPQRGMQRVDHIGEMLLRRVVALRLVGNVKVAGLVKGRPFDIKAGDKLKVAGFIPDAPAQRIASVTYNADGTADCTLERSYNLAAMLFRLTARRRRTTPHKWGAGHRS